MIYVGIDPGLTGAIAVISEKGQLRLLVDTPVMRVGKKHAYDLPAMIGFLHEFQQDNTMAGLELVHSMPKQGVASSFSFGKGFGYWEALLAAMKIPYTLVTPQAWKKVMMLGMGKEKGASRLRAQQLFPEADLSLVKHHGRGDALLIAAYMLRTAGGAHAKP